MQAMAEHPGNRGIEWRGDWYETEFKGLYAASETFRQVVEEWNGPKGPNTLIHRSIGVNVGEDLFMSYTDLLIEYSQLDVAEEVSILLTDHMWNIFHIAALHGWMKTPSYFHRKLHDQVVGLLDVGKDQEAAAALNRVAGALLQIESGTGRTALHTAILMHGVNSTFSLGLIALERCASSAHTSTHPCSFWSLSYSKCCIMHCPLFWVDTSLGDWILQRRWLKSNLPMSICRTPETLSDTASSTIFMVIPRATTPLARLPSKH